MQDTTRNAIERVCNPFNRLGCEILGRTDLSSICSFLALRWTVDLGQTVDSVERKCGAVQFSADSTVYV